MGKLLVLGFAFFFFAEVGGPLQFTCVPMELEAAFFAFAGVKPENGAVVLHVHHACASGKFGAAERTFTRFRHATSRTG